MEVENVLTLTDIIIYPIKSLGGVKLVHGDVMEQGLRNDRRWMLVDGKGRFMTIRNRPSFLFFSVEIQPNGILVRFKSNELLLPFEPDSMKMEETKVWNDSIQAVKGNIEHSQWFSDMLGEYCELMYIPENGNRFMNPEWGDSRVSLADGYPYLVIGEESLHDLNKKLDSPIEMARFRPNLVFSGGSAYAEFSWGRFKVGSVSFQGLKPCIRCNVTTFDLNTAEKGREPLLTLSKQKIDGNIVFGQHAAARTFGRIKLGDSIKVDTYKHSPYDPIETS